MAHLELTRGALSAVHQGQEPPSPVVQIIKFAAVPGPTERYRLLVSDGEFCMQATATTQLNKNFQDGSFQVGSVIRLDEYICNEANTKKLIIVMNATSLGPPVAIIGNPSNIPSSEEAAPSSVASAHPQQGKPDLPAPPAWSAASRQAQNPALPPPPVLPPYPHGQPQQVQQLRAPETLPYSSNRQQQPTGAFRPQSSGVASVSTDGAPIIPISALNPYTSRWTIRCRVAFKAPVKQWENARGQGRVSSIDLLDASGEIRCTLFNEAVDQFYPLLEANRVYEISRGVIKADQKDRKFTSSLNPYEMTLNQQSVVREVADDGTVPSIKLAAPISIRDLAEKNPDDIVDLIAIVMNVGELGSVTTKKDQRQLPKRVISLADDSETSVDLTIWGDDAVNCTLTPDQVVACKNVRVSDFGGRSLNAISATYFVPSPPDERANQLAQYWSQAGPAKASIQPLTQRQSASGFGVAPYKTLLAAKEESQSTSATIFLNRATVMQIKHDENAPLYYTACPIEGCNKKVLQNERGMWFCSKCNQEYPNNTARYVISLLIADESSGVWVNAFNDDTVQLLGGYEANQVRELREQGNPNLHLIFDMALFKRYTFKLKAQDEMYNDELKFRCTILGLQPLDYVSESRKLIEKIREFA